MFPIITNGLNCNYISNGKKACAWSSYSIFSDIKLQIGNFFYTIPNSAYINVTTISTQLVWEILIEPTGETYSQPSVIVGDVFMRNYYIYFDAGNKEVMLYGTFSMSTATYTSTVMSNTDDSVLLEMNILLVISLFMMFIW